jgi:hypothetical protein
MQLTNMPKGDVEFELDIDTIILKGNGSRMGQLLLLDKLFKDPEALRRTVGRALVSAIMQAKSAGYRQCQEDIRAVLGWRNV